MAPRLHSEELSPNEILARSDQEQQEDRARKKNALEAMTPATKGQLVAAFTAALDGARLSETEARHTLKHFPSGTIATMLLAPLTWRWRPFSHSHHAEAVRVDAEARGKIIPG